VRNNLHKISTQNTLETIRKANSFLEEILSRYPVKLPFRPNNSINIIEVLNFLKIQQELKQFFQDTSAFDFEFNAAFSLRFHSSHMKDFLCFKNNSLTLNLDLLVQNHITDTSLIERIIYNLPNEIKISVFEVIHQNYSFLNGSLFTGYLLLDLQNNIQNGMTNFANNPIQTITVDGIFMDYQNICRSTTNLKYYLDIIRTKKSILNPSLQNAIFLLISSIPNFEDIQTSYRTQFNQLNQQDPNTLIQELICHIPGFLITLFQQTPLGFNNFKQKVKKSLNTNVLNQKLVWHNLLLKMLQNTNLTSESKSRIIQLCNFKKISNHKYRLFNILMAISSIQTNTQYTNIIEEFLKIQTNSNNGAQKFAQLCKQITLLTKFKSEITPHQYETASDLISSIQQDIIRQSLTIIGLDFLEERFQGDLKSRLEEIIDPISHITTLSNIRDLQKIILAHVLKTPRVIKMEASSISESIPETTIQNFLTPITYTSDTLVTQSTFDLKQILFMGHYPELTCLNHVNGDQKDELIAMALCNDRMLIQCRNHNSIIARAILRLLKSHADHNMYGILMDNFYGSETGIFHIFTALKIKAETYNFKLLLPHSVNTEGNNIILQNLISRQETIASRNDFDTNVSNPFSQNQSAVTSTHLIEVKIHSETQ